MKYVKTAAIVAFTLVLLVILSAVSFFGGAKLAGNVVQANCDHDAVIILNEHKYVCMDAKIFHEGIEQLQKEAQHGP